MVGGEAFKKAKQAATEIIQDNTALNKLFGDVNEKLSSSKKYISEFAGNIAVMTRMVKAYASGKYKLVPWKSIIVITAVLIYFVMPLDLIPDFIPVTGYMDDMAVVLWAYNHLIDDINTFLVWEKSQSTPE